MQLSSILATALLPLLAVAETSTTTSTMTMTKYITIKKVATSSIYSANSTSLYLPTGTGTGIITSSSLSLPTTTTGANGSPTTVAPTVSPTIDNNNGASMGSTPFALAGLAGIVVAALIRTNLQTPKDLNLSFFCRIPLVTIIIFRYPISTSGLVIVLQDLEHPLSAAETLGWE
ncbi:hypothetical protein M426DRAFT_25288 [Hypoxylon sp. CI-4A]|nr:hypothetical protein M426DRAFT_25288 [Hypoxylon sp. CI-4A]